MIQIPNTIRWEDQRLFLIDQTLLPLQEAIIEPTTVESVFEAIKMLRVRGGSCHWSCRSLWGGDCDEETTTINSLSVL